MSRGTIFWVMMLIWLVFGLIGYSGIAGPYQHGVMAVGSLFEFILFALLGWQVYGPAIHG